MRNKKSGQDKLLSYVIRKYETCRECGRSWNISTNSVYDKDKYLCPHCSYKKREKRKNKLKNKKKIGFKSILGKQKDKYKGIEV